LHISQQTHAFAQQQSGVEAVNPNGQARWVNTLMPQHVSWPACISQHFAVPQGPALQLAPTPSMSVPVVIGVTWT
jgi:hypothetical protein